MEPDEARRRIEGMFLRYGPLMLVIAVRKFGIPVTDADSLVHDIFIIYVMQAEEVENPEKYFIACICNAARNYLGRCEEGNELFCGEEPCAATPTAAMLIEAAQLRKRFARRALQESIAKAEALPPHS